MRKLNKKPILLLATVPLVACNAGNSKQKAVDPLTAKEVLTNIIQAFCDDSFSVNVPKKFTSLTSHRDDYGYAFEEYDPEAGHFENITEASGDLKKGIFHIYEIMTYENEIYKSNGYEYESFIIFKNDKVICVDESLKKWDEFDPETFFEGAPFEPTIEGYAEYLYTYDSYNVYVNLSVEDYIFNKEAHPERPGAPMKSEIEYTYFYGSNNNNSVQIEERFTSDDKSSWYDKLDIRDFVIKNYESCYTYIDEETGKENFEGSTVDLLDDAKIKVPDYSQYKKGLVL